MTSLSRTDQLTLSCLRDRAHADHDDLVEAIGAIRRWDRVVDAWEGQGLLSLVTTRMAEAGLLDVCPPAMRALLTRIDAQYERMSRAYSEETTRLIAALRSEGVRSLVLKDARGYPQPWTRPGYDLDLLILREDLNSAHEVLTGLDFVAETSPYREARVDKVRGFNRYQDGLRLTVDLHWNLVGGYLPKSSRFEAATLFDRAEYAPLYEHSIPVLGLSDHIVNVAMHCYQHECRWPSRLITWTDIAEAIRADPDRVDWADVVARTHEWDSAGEVHLGLSVARDLLGAPVPDFVLTDLDREPRRLGIDASLFGYLNYSWKSVDKLEPIGSTLHVQRAKAAAEATFAAARWSHQVLVELVRGLRERGHPVATFGEAGVLLPDPSVPAFGRVDVLTGVLADGELGAVATALGFTETASGWVLVDVGTDRRVRLSVCRAESAPRVLNENVTTRDYLKRALTPARAAGNRHTVEVQVLVGGPGARLAYLCGRYAATAAVDPAGIAEVAALVAELPPNAVAATRRHCPPQGQLLVDIATHGARWSEDAGLGYRETDEPALLDALDNRTRALEELTKFLITPLGVVTIMARTGARRAAAVALARLLLAPPVERAVRQWRVLLAALWRPGEGRRVPPRVYLTREGQTLTGLRGPTAASPPEPEMTTTTIRGIAAWPTTRR